MTAGPVFPEEMWRLACCALQDAFSATLEPVKVMESWVQRPGTEIMNGVHGGRLPQKASGVRCGGPQSVTCMGPQKREQGGFASRGGLVSAQSS